MAIMQGNAEFMDAARNGTPEILKIMAEGTGLTPEVIDSTRQRWTFMSPDGLPNMPSILGQQRYWHEKTDLLARMVPENQIFDDPRRARGTQADGQTRTPSSDGRAPEAPAPEATRSRQGGASQAHVL